MKDFPYFEDYMHVMPLLISIVSFKQDDVVADQTDK